MKKTACFFICLLVMSASSGATQHKSMTTMSDSADTMGNSHSTLNAAADNATTAPLSSLNLGYRNNEVDDNLLYHGDILAQHGRWYSEERHWPERKHRQQRRYDDDRHYQRQYRSHFKHHRHRPDYYKKHHKKHHKKHYRHRYWNGRYWRYCEPGSRHPKCLWRYPSTAYDHSGLIIYYRD